MNASQLQVIASKLYSLLFGEKICGSKFWQIFRGILANIPSRLIFGFAYLHYIYLISILMVQKEDKTPNKSCS